MQIEAETTRDTYQPIKRRVIVVALNDRGNRIGETHHNAKIPDVMVDRIRELHEDCGLGPNGISKTVGVSLTAVRKICYYNRRADTPARWKRIKVPVIPKPPQIAIATPLPEDELRGVRIPSRQCFNNWSSPMFLKMQMVLPIPVS